MTRRKESTLRKTVQSLYVPIYIATVPMRVSWRPLEGSEKLNIPVILSRSTQLRIWHLDCLDTEPVREFGYTAGHLMRRIKKEALLSLANVLIAQGIALEKVVGWGRWVHGASAATIGREMENAD